jgi:hypothetical protein
MTRVELLAYAAGYFDGEGCISMQINPWGRYLRMVIVSYDRDSLQVFSDLFGGQVKYVNHGKKMAYRWDKNGRFAQPALRELAPLLRSNKKGKALKALEIRYSDVRTVGGKFVKSQF